MQERVEGLKKLIPKVESQVLFFCRNRLSSVRANESTTCVFPFCFFALLFLFYCLLFVFLSNFYFEASTNNADKKERRLGVIFDAIFKFKMIADKLTKHFSG